MEQANIRNGRKVQPKPNESFISLARVAAQRNRELVQRTIEARALDDTVVVYVEEVDGSGHEKTSLVQPIISIRCARLSRTPSVEKDRCGHCKPGFDATSLALVSNHDTSCLRQELDVVSESNESAGLGVGLSLTNRSSSSMGRVR